MAFSIRELSKRLGQYRLKLKVHNIFLLTKAHDPTLIKLTRQVAEWLLSEESGGDHTVYVENTLREARQFDAAGLVDKDPSYKDRLRYWDNELCQTAPHTFDIIIAVRSPRSIAIYIQLTSTPARRRRHSPIRILALPKRRPARSLFRAWLSRLPDEVRL